MKAAFRLPPLLLLALSACATVAQGPRAETPRLRDVPANTEVKAYEIHGDDADALRAQMNALGPVDQAGARSDAYTRWFVTWRYPLVETNGTCATGPVTVTLTVSMDLPAWVEAEQGADALKRRWQEYLDALVVHETGHHANAVRAAQEIEQALPAIPAAPSCDEIQRVANAKGHALLEQYRQADVAYDAKTDHGATQGARFP